MPDSPSVLLYDKHEHVVTLTLNRPKALNALDAELLEALGQSCAEIDADPEVRAAVITGSGRGFCAGGDLKSFNFAGAQTGAVVGNAADHWAAKLLGVTKPTLAAVNGVTAGGGLSLALGCDIRIASEQARFSAIFAKIGMSVLDGNAWLLTRAVGLSKALELLYTAEFIDGHEAKRIGLVSDVVPHEEVLPRTLEMAARIAANAPVALQLTKNVVYDALGKTFIEHLPSQWAAQQTNRALALHDIAEGGRAFSEKRPARFRGLEAPED
jgi:2-(1,2-epoxy-1,2-dihydrophenyl)acetyl-CoA isomerase